MKLSVKFLCEKLDNAIEIMGTLRLSLENMIVLQLDKWNSAFVTSSRARQRKKPIQCERLKLHQTHEFESFLTIFDSAYSMNC